MGSHKVASKCYAFTKNSQMTSIGTIFTSTCHTIKSTASVLKAPSTGSHGPPPTRSHDPPTGSHDPQDDSDNNSSTNTSSTHHLTDHGESQSVVSLSREDGAIKSPPEY